MDDVLRGMYNVVRPVAEQFSRQVVSFLMARRSQSCANIAQQVYNEFAKVIDNAKKDFENRKAGVSWDGSRLAYPHRTGFRPVSDRFQTSFRPVSDQFQTGFRPVSDQCHAGCTVHVTVSPPPCTVHVIMSCQMHSHVGCTEVSCRMHSVISDAQS